MRLLKKVLVFGIVAFMMFGANIKPVSAEEGRIGLVLGPTSQRVMLQPGETYRSSVHVSNPYSSVGDMQYILYVTPYGVLNDNYDPVFDKATAYTQIVDWIELDKTEGSLSPNEKEDIGFTINVPIDAPAGGQYATIMAQDVTNADQSVSGGLNISNITVVGSILVADIAGETRNEGSVIENSFPTFLFKSPLSTTSLVRNDGNVHTDAKYTLQVWPLFSSEEICTNEESPDAEIVLPETSKYHIQSCNLPGIGIFNVKQTVTIFGTTSVTEKLIFVCPIWLLFIILFVIILFVIWIFTRTKSKKSSKKAEN